MTAYYNEIDKYAAQWLRNLIEAGHIAKGVVDERSIEDVRPSDLIGFKQCHFFAGIGGWSVALRLAGWPDDKPVWTGSCPCQPFSQAGKGEGVADKRNLWPSWFYLIEQCKPPIIFGEQVEAAIKHRWLDLVQDDLEGSGYTFAAVGLPASCVESPHTRARLWFVANSDMSNGTRLEQKRIPMESKQETNGRGNFNYWQKSELIRCADGKQRPIEPGVFPLANGIPNRVGRLRAYGNAIVPQVAEQIIRAFYDVGY